jgi:hypothetical protein
MARKQEKVTIADEGRDLGKTFVLTEMPAWDAVKWATRAYLALAQQGTQIPDGALTSGDPELIAATGLTLLSLIPEHVAMSLLDEAKACIQFQPSDNSAIALQPVLFGGISAIEEPGTWLALLRRVFSLHVGFSTVGAPPTTG